MAVAGECEGWCGSWGLIDRPEKEREERACYGDLPPLNVATFRERISGGANQVPPAGIVQSLFSRRKTSVSESHFPKSDPVSGQAVALGENLLKRRTGVAGEEVDSSAEPEPGGSAARRSARGRVMAPDIVFTRWPQ